MTILDLFILSVINSFLVIFSVEFLLRMRIQPEQPRKSCISFDGYRSTLKTYFKQGKFPSVKYGFYGDKLTTDNVSLEHLLPHSKGGKTELDNLVLASKNNNSSRGNKDIKDFIDPKNFKRYVEQFIGVKYKDFDGNKYILGILKTINELLGK